MTRYVMVIDQRRCIGCHSCTVACRTWNKLPLDIVYNPVVSEGVQGLVSGLSVPPAFLIAKGGITSSDIGTKALKVRRAEVMGQILPGIPVWKTGPESRFPEIPYVIFPGNVGSETDLRRAVEILEA